MSVYSDTERKHIARALRIMSEKAAVYGEVIATPDQARTMARLSLAGLEREEFHVFYLTSQNQLIHRAAEFIGTLDAASVYPREVVKRALELNAGAVIFAHNHPSGKADPSEADRRITLRLRDALALVDIRVLDHLVVGATEVKSMAEGGLI